VGGRVLKGSEMRACNAVQLIILNAASADSHQDLNILCTCERDLGWERDTKMFFNLGRPLCHPKGIAVTEPNYHRGASLDSYFNLEKRVNKRV
jgi:hypothetical protein